MTACGSVISCPFTLSIGNGPGAGRFRWNAFISFQMSPIGVNRLNLDANECQDLVRSELKTRLQFAAALFVCLMVCFTHASFKLF